MNRGAHPRAAPIPFGILVLVLVAFVAGLTVWRVATADRGGVPMAADPDPGVEPAPAPGDGAGDGGSPADGGDGGGRVWPTPEPINTAFPGLTTFRGNASRTYHGEGPVPQDPVILWRYPASGGLCSVSSDARGPRTWCGTGWTGQPNVLEHEDGSLEVRIGAYDGHYHFLDGETGRPLRPSLPTGDLAKGSATSDPDGYPLYYGGSRDDELRVIALDRAEPTVLWRLDSRTSVPNPVWNTDWDGAPLVIDDHLLVGGENSWFYAIRLNRGYRPNGKVTVDPEVVLTVPGFDDRLFADVGDQDVSIESSVAFRDDVAYFANSGGLVQGWDVSEVLRGGSDAERVFRFWTGDDTDATVVIDDEGFLYVASELERYNARSEEVGQLMKLDPSRPNDPLVWSIPVTETAGDGKGGMWATPALHRNFLYQATNHGHLIAVNRETGKVAWRIKLPGPTWSSPVVVDDVLVQGDCDGYLHAYDVDVPWRKPSELWSIRLEAGCIESTPAVWKGRIWVGTRAGGFFGIGDAAG